MSVELRIGIGEPIPWNRSTPKITLRQSRASHLRIGRNCDFSLPPSFSLLPPPSGALPPPCLPLPASSPIPSVCPSASELPYPLRASLRRRAAPSPPCLPPSPPNEDALLPQLWSLPIAPTPRRRPLQARTRQHPTPDATAPSSSGSATPFPTSDDGFKLRAGNNGFKLGPRPSPMACHPRCPLPP
ncbi:hypothetical protein PR202_gb09436 [Eleusine coracana subsp. coracana]|uniref:Uncharacterized protein n=1 Tax=Eleusine coracana subsp. coracana TaxID=191504 RepID=A0AAV5EEX5_ELECO|nr:hypothetical protein PR202_gb09436 [Eleusine coracana subsp. coracana]